MQEQPLLWTGLVCIPPVVPCSCEMVQLLRGGSGMVPAVQQDIESFKELHRGDAGLWLVWSTVM